MLYSPAWDKTSLLDRWIAWLETKDPDERYDWKNLNYCACGQFFGNGSWIKEDGDWRLMNKIARGERRDDASYRFDDPLGWTFGACLDRAKGFRALNPRA